MIDWINDASLRLISSRSADSGPTRRFLVFLVPSTRHASPLLKALQGPRNFDLAVRFYEPPGVNEGLVEAAEFVMTGGLSKFHAAYLFLESFRLAQSYDGYLFLDGDLDFDGRQLSQFLSFVDAARLDLAQPSVTRDSYCYWRMAYHQSLFILRETTFVEVMAPFLSKHALATCMPTFAKSISTYGLDLVWPSLIGSEAIGVVDAFQVRHADRVDHASGNFYKYLKSIGVDLDEEERRILEEYGVTPMQARSRRGYFWKRAPSGSAQPRQLVSIPLGEPEARMESQILIDAAMFWARWRPMRSERVEDQLAEGIWRHFSGGHFASAPSQGRS